MRRTVAVLVLVVVMLLVTTAAAYARPAEWYTIAVHYVGWGQTLYSIGRAYGVRWQAIAAYNGLANPNRIYAGQRLRIPNAYIGGPGPGPGCYCRYRHVVRPGQNLYRISAWYGVNMWRVARCNNILNLNRIYVGQRLCIP